MYVDYNPSSGVTFRENKNSDVQVVGKGYNEDGTSLDSRSLNGINKKANDKRRVTKGKCTLLDMVFYFLYKKEHSILLMDGIALLCNFFF